ncbi:unnamed protein product [Effrenium voratum]|nr:unnamed protein product [Effrenium voratum]
MRCILHWRPLRVADEADWGGSINTIWWADERAMHADLHVASAKHQAESTTGIRPFRLAAEDASKHAEAVTLATEDTFAEESCWGKLEDEKCQTKKKDSEGHFTYGKCHCPREHYGLAEVGLRRVYLWGLCKNELVCK